MRNRLEDRRATETVEVTHRTPDSVQQEFVMGIGRYSDGRIAEVWVDIPWSGKAQMSLSTLAAKDAALIISIALQHGATVEELLAGIGRSEVNHLGRMIEMPHTIIGTILATLRSIE